jgi:hypothetical protein
MNFATYKKVFPILMKNKIPVFLWGSQGVGKTQGTKSLVKSMGMDIRVLYAGTQADPGDLIGLLHKDEKSGTVSHLPPSWFPKDKDSRGVVFLDELNRANPEIIQALFSFPVSGDLHTHKLPEGWYVMGAGNYDNGRFNVTDTSDSAWISRYCHIDFKPTTEEWLIFAEDKGYFEIASFIRENPSMLEIDENQGGKLDMTMFTPDRRAWADKLGSLSIDPDFLALDEGVQYEIFSGCIGPAAAAAFFSWKAKGERRISLKEILVNYRKDSSLRKKIEEAKKENRFDAMNQPVDELFSRLDNNHEFLSKDGYLDNLKAFLLDIPVELAMKVFSKMSSSVRFYGKNEILNDPEYVKKFN